jgi:signal peptidase I
MGRRAIRLGVFVLVLAGCGGSDSGAASDEDQVRAVIARYASALADGPVEDICDVVAMSALESRLGIQGKDVRGKCREAVRKVPEQLGAGDKDRFRSVKVTSVKITGDTGTAGVEMTVGGRPSQTTAEVVREADGWKISTIPRPPRSADGQDPYRVPSGAMLPTLKIGDVVYADTQAYADAKPKIDDIVILHPPEGAEQMRCGVKRPARALCPKPVANLSEIKFIKRVVGLPGDTIAFRHGRVIRNGAVETLDLEPCRPSDLGCDFPKPITVPAGHYFMAGDNRAASDDSRYWGPVPLRAIIGRVDEEAP